jgi:uncharacterized protein (DUF983 family)
VPVQVGIRMQTSPPSSISIGVLAPIFFVVTMRTLRRVGSLVCASTFAVMVGMRKRKKK